MIDFARSSMTFVLPNGGNIARIQLDAACTLRDAAGQATTYYLIAPCRAERMYVDEPLFQLPNYEFCGIWSATDFMIIRTHWVSERDNRQVGAHLDRFAECRLDIQTHPSVSVLDSAAPIVAATLANRVLVARTELRDDATGRTAVLEYPIKTMNVLPGPARFQVDTGPLLVPDWRRPTASPIECFDLAHVVYHRLDQAEFILRRPRPVDDQDPTSPAVTDYTQVQQTAATTVILASGT